MHQGVRKYGDEIHAISSCRGGNWPISRTTDPDDDWHQSHRGVADDEPALSAPEEFTYSLKNLGRATVVGETTGGGAHPRSPRRIDDQFVVNVPTGRAINPITKTS
jgi:hypothetical protein